MKPRSRKRYTLLASVLLVVGSLSLACVLWVRAEQRQYAMNRELIDSLKQGDLQRALKLVEAGADPNTRFTPMPPPAWRDLLNQLVKHSAPSANNSPTAFMIVCGDIYREGYDYLLPLVPEDHIHDPYMMHLAKVMIVHGANVNAREEKDKTALMWACRWELRDQMTLLLEHGALIDLQDYDGDTALHFAVTYDNVTSVKLLLKYQANPNLRAKNGDTPLSLASLEPSSPEIIRLLKAAGATR